MAYVIADMEIDLPQWDREHIAKIK
jgi:hypothetical protein